MKRRREQATESEMAWFDRIDRGLRRAVLLLAVLLILVQGALQLPVLRSWLTPVERLEGIPFEEDHGS